MPHESYADRRAELQRQAADYTERADRAAAHGSSVGAREWLQAAEAAYDAITALDQAYGVEAVE